MCKITRVGLCDDGMYVHFTFQLPLVTSSHNVGNSSACSGGQSVIRHKIKDRSKEGVYCV